MTNSRMALSNLSCLGAEEAYLTFLEKHSWIVRGVLDKPAAGFRRLSLFSSSPPAPSKEKMFVLQQISLPEAGNWPL